MESSLSLLYKQIKGELGSFLGYGRGPDNNDSTWTTAQSYDLDTCLASGLRQFYWPAPLDGAHGSYDWSFLKPVATLFFDQGESTVDIPDDFGGFEGQITCVATSSTSVPWAIQWRNEGSIREMYSVSSTITGPPMYAAEAPLKGTGGDRGQRSQLIIFPLADQDYSLQVQYYISPDFLSGAFPYAYGGAPHAETILESCLAIAEQRRDDAMSVHTMKFKERLAASISMDRRNKPQKLGRNIDRSDNVGWSRTDVHSWAPAATYNGGTFS